MPGVKAARGETLSAPKVDSVNTFEAPAVVAPKKSTVKVSGGKVSSRAAAGLGHRVVAGITFTRGWNPGSAGNGHSIDRGSFMRQIFYLALLIASTCGAQEGAQFQAAETNVWGAEYPRVDAAGRVQMRIKAPEATKVRLNFWSGPKVDMEKQADGFWTFTTRPRAGPSLLRVQRGRRRRQRSRQPGRSSAAAVRERRRGARSQGRPTTPSRTCLTVRCAMSGITPGSRVPGGTPWSTCRRTTKRRRRSVIPCSICSTAAARTKPAGSGKGAPTSSSTT